MSIPLLDNRKSRQFSLIDFSDVPKEDLYFIIDMRGKTEAYEMYQHEPSGKVYIHLIHLLETDQRPHKWFRIDYE